MIMILSLGVLMLGLGILIMSLGQICNILLYWRQFKRTNGGNGNNTTNGGVN